MITAPKRQLPVTESSVTLPPELEAIASWSSDPSAPRAKREPCWRGWHPAPLASTSGRSSALRANTSIRLWLTYYSTRWSLSKRTHGFVDNCKRPRNAPQVGGLCRAGPRSRAGPPAHEVAECRTVTWFRSISSFGPLPSSRHGPVRRPASLARMNRRQSCRGQRKRVGSSRNTRPTFARSLGSYSARWIEVVSVAHREPQWETAPATGKKAGATFSR